MKLGTINDLTDQYKDAISSTADFYDSLFQNLADHSNELLPSVAIGIVAGFSSACTFRSLAIMNKSMPPILVSKTLSPYLSNLQKILFVVSISARLVGDTYYNYEFHHNTPSQSLRNASVGIGLTFLSGLMTFGETIFIGLMMAQSAIPMTGEKIFLLSIFGGFLSSTQDIFLRNHYQIIDQPLQA